MNDRNKAIQLTAGEVKVSCVAEEVFFCRGQGAVLVCAFVPGEGAGGAVLIPASRASSGRKLFEDLISRFRPSEQGKLQVKLIGAARLRKQVSEWASARQVPVAGEADAGEFEAFYYVGTGRVRMTEVSPAQAEAAPVQPSVPVQKKNEKARVLIVDDSQSIRKLLRSILSRDSEIEVVGEAEKPSEVEGLIQKLKPNVITLDIHMPEMDGVTLLEKYIAKYPIPTIMVTSISLQEGNYVLRALNIGAVDYVQKPSMEEIKTVAPIIIEKVKMAANVDVASKKPAPQAPARPSSFAGGSLDMSTVLAVGASTGGVQALEFFLKGMPEKIPPVVIVQHIPPVFSAAFAKRLNDLCPFEVKEAADGDEVKPGRVLIAAGGTQMAVVQKAGKLVVRVNDDAPVNRHKPSVDYLFDSVASVLGKKAVGVILTGMGADGARGLLKMRQAGAHTFAQDEQSCVVFGMPREAINMGAAEKVVSLQGMSEAVIRIFAEKKAA